MVKTVITIGRQYGSDGLEIANYIGRKLAIPVYDKHSPYLAVKEEDHGSSHEDLLAAEVGPQDSFLYSLVMDTYAQKGAAETMNDMPFNHKMFIEQMTIIRKLAERGPCVFLGRCSDYALEENPYCVSVFTYADLETRIQRVISRNEGMDDLTARNLVLKRDKASASYYNYYTTKKWGDKSSYDICIDTTHFTVENAGDVIIKYAELYERQVMTSH